MKLAATAVIAALAITLTGCDDLDKVMGRNIQGTPVTAPEPEQKVHCDLIFPGGGTTNKT